MPPSETDSPEGRAPRPVNPSLYSYAGSNPAPATSRKGPLTWAFARRRPFVVVRLDPTVGGCLRFSGRNTEGSFRLCGRWPRGRHLTHERVDLRLRPCALPLALKSGRPRRGGRPPRGDKCGTEEPSGWSREARVDPLDESSDGRAEGCHARTCRRMDPRPSGGFCISGSPGHRAPDVRDAGSSVLGPPGGRAVERVLAQNDTPKLSSARCATGRSRLTPSGPPPPPAPAHQARCRRRDT